MFVSTTAFVALLAAVVRAELGANDTAVIEEYFDNALLTDLFKGNFTPEGLVVGRWPSNTSISIGQPVAPETAKEFPALSIQPAPGANFSSDALYTATLVDAKQAGTNATGDNQVLHWLINNIHIKVDNATKNPYPLDYFNGTTVIDYAGPNPPPEDAPHRYVFLVFAQPENFTAPQAYSTAKQYPNPQPFDLPKYIEDAKLGSIMGANFFTVGTGNVTVEGGNGTTNGTNGGNGTSNGGAVPTKTTNATISAPTDGTADGSASGNNSANGGADGTGSPNSTESNPAAASSSDSGAGWVRVPAMATLFTAGFAAAAAALL